MRLSPFVPRFNGQPQQPAPKFSGVVRLPEADTFDFEQLRDDLHAAGLKPMITGAFQDNDMSNPFNSVWMTEEPPEDTNRNPAAFAEWAWMAPEFTLQALKGNYEETLVRIKALLQLNNTRSN